MLIAIDHGNKQIKTVNKNFVSGLSRSRSYPPFGGDVLKYKDVYYTLSSERIPYMRDKTGDARFFILTLFAIVYELEAACFYSDDGVIEIDLAVGLPPAHFGALSKRFAEYFHGEDEIVDFEFNKKPYSVYISRVEVYPQALSAAMLIFNKIKEHPKTTVIDIGGFTADYLQIINGQPNLSASDSLENGVITLYNDIIKTVNSEHDLLISEEDIDAVIAEKVSGLSGEIENLIRERCVSFVTDIVNKLRERMIDLRTGYTVFVGGGSLLLKSFIENHPKITNICYIDDPKANAKGYDAMFRRKYYR